MGHYLNYSLVDIDGEVWKFISFNNRYMVSNMGRVKALGSGSKRSTSYPKIIKQYLNHYGYLFIRIKKHNSVKNFYVHRLVADAFIPNPDNKPHINHIRGIKTDNRISEIEWNTNLENQRHRYKTGIVDISGEKNASSKLKAHQVLDIFSSTESSKTICKKYNVSGTIIRCIRTGKIWSSVTGKEYKQKRFYDKKTGKLKR